MMNRYKTSAILPVFLLVILVIFTFGCINITLPNASTDNTGTTGIKDMPPAHTYKEAPVIESFIASSERTLVGGTKTLSWSVKNADSILITPDIGNVPSTGSKSVTVNAAITYTLVASNANGMKSTSLFIAPMEIINIQPGAVGAKSSDTKKPDLIISAVTNTGGEHPHAMCYVKNGGEANSVPFKCALYIDGLKEAEEAVNVIIPPGVEIPVTIWTYTYEKALEGHRTEIRLDVENTNNESNENNNIGAINYFWK